MLHDENPEILKLFYCPFEIEIATRNNALLRLVPTRR